MKGGLRRVEIQIRLDEKREVQTMEISCSTVCFVHLPVEQAVRKIADFGFQNLELLAVRGWIGEYVHVDAVKTPFEYVKRLCETNKIRLTSLHPGSLIVLNEDALKKSVDYLKSAATMADSLGVRKVIVTGGPRIEMMLDRYIQGLKVVLEHIRGLDVEICVENHFQSQVETLEDMKRVATELDDPQVGITVDTGHFTSSRVSLESVMKQLGSYIRHVHIKDHKGTQSVALGRGETRNKDFVRQLRGSGYKGMLCMELEVEDQENIDTYLREGREYMVNFLSG